MTLSVNLYGPYNDLGYGIASKNILKELSKRLDVTYFPIGQLKNHVDNLYLYKDFKKTSPTIKIWHEHDLLSSIGNGPKIGFPIFEKNKFNLLEAKQISGCDYIIVCSEWAKQIALNYNKNVYVAPLGVDNDFMFSEPPLKDKVIFYNQGKREVRKGHDYLHRVFAKAFPTENVELWMFSQNPFDSETETNLFKTQYRRILGNRVKFFPFMPKEDMIKWIKLTHVGFFPTRSEGFCLPILEGMKLGKHILATNYSGHTEYLPEDQTFSCNSFIDARDDKWFNGGFEWAEIERSENEIIEKLRQIYKKVVDGSLYNPYNIKVASKFSWGNTGDKIDAIIRRV